MRLILLTTFIVLLFVGASIAKADLLPGWTMYFFDLQWGKDLEIKVTQTEPDPSEGFAEATGFGRFVIGSWFNRIRGYLHVEQASWSDWRDYPDAGFPENALVKGKAQIGIDECDFELDLISNGFPDPGSELDEAHLTISDKGIINKEFRGQLHHSRLRALLAPPRSSPASRSRTTITWGALKKR